nr:MAG TPA: Mechanosensitive ion channel [Caudoviricetes sp.]
MSRVVENKAGQVLIILVIVFIVTLVIEFILARIKTKNGRVNTGVTLVKSMAKYIGAFIALIWILTILGIDVNTIFASVGIVALIVGFSAESLIADVITGIFMIFENQFNVGDVVEINGYWGEVKEIGVRTTSIIDSGNNIKIINNSQINNLINLSEVNSSAVCDIRISYENDLTQTEDAVKEILKKIYEDNPNIFLDIPIYSGVQELTDKAIILRIVASVMEKDLYKCKRILNRDLFLGLKKSGILIPYDKQSVC